eukprot:SAG25_NODE_3342_length_1121_cov_1.184932_3_plen_85_part_01
MHWNCRYYYERVLKLGGAGYKATGRGFDLGHHSFLKLFKMFHYSHMNYGMTLVANLVVYRWFIIDPESYHLPSTRIRILTTDIGG